MVERQRVKADDFAVGGSCGLGRKVGSRQRG